MKTLLLITVFMANSLGEPQPHTDAILMEDTVECAVMAREVQHVAYEMNKTIFTSCKPLKTRDEYFK